MQGFISGDLGFQGLEFRVRGVGVQARLSKLPSFPKCFARSGIGNVGTLGKTRPF